MGVLQAAVQKLLPISCTVVLDVKLGVSEHRRNSVFLQSTVHCNQNVVMNIQKMLLRRGEVRAPLHSKARQDGQGAASSG
eukprot:CAMPEP_0204422378 /NCGR_PEP_ID=MMETSP0470-20130426/35437_1 /ASSEMBLY_ACC=CAM_ASM_000385 /TAXON_ID=2969 /ORGANISM="Oxyrrhis marina" /LENGTH=79 /DNA_ID=CAMNT_0051419601 /DNA_START=130 /DNA_END=369 /DNA_ORIENTATION=+